MACSKYQYVKQYQQHRTALKKCFILVRIDGRSFTNFCQAHHFQKPNDLRAIKLMNSAAMFVCKKFKDIFLAYGQSDQYSFVLGRHSQLFNRRIDKIQTCIVSAFTSAYVHNWRSFFGKTLQQSQNKKINQFQYELQQLPTFDARIVVYPDLQTIKDYFKWRQVDCHINNLYNTVFWCMMKSQKYDNQNQINKRQEHQQEKIQGRIEQNQQHNSEKNDTIQIQGKKNKKRKKQIQKNTYIQSILKDTNSGQKNQILFSEFGINYNNIQAIYRRGTILCYRKVQLENNKSELESIDAKSKNMPKISKQLKSSIRQLKDVAQNTDKILDKLSNFKQPQQKVPQNIGKQQNQIYKQLQGVRKQVEGMRGKYLQIDKRISNIKNKNRQAERNKHISHHKQGQEKECQLKGDRRDNQYLKLKKQTKQQQQQTQQKKNLNISNKSSESLKNKIRNKQQYIIMQCHQDLIKQQFWQTIKID